MNARVTPALALVAALVLAVAAVIATVYLALHQPWIGLGLSASASGDALVVRSTTSYGPNGSLPPGSRIVAIGPDGGETIPLLPTDLVEEPDTFDSFAGMDGFFRRQGLLHQILSAPVVRAELEVGGERIPDAEINVAPRRAPADLPPVFWVQVFVGTVGFLIGVWVWGLKRSELSAFFFALAGFGLMLSALPAAVYSTRELALPELLFARLSGLNYAGALTFGAGMIGLFLSYPRRLVSGPVAFLPALILGLWIGADALRLFAAPALSRHLPIALALVSIAAGVAIQFWKTRGDPRARAVLRWLGLSVLTGAGLFVLTVTVPALFGAEQEVSQGYSFLYFLIIYVGVALGVSRYRLFELEEWAFRILFYMAGILLIVLLDIVLVLLVSFDDIPAFSLSFVLVALFYLPFRDGLWRYFLSRGTPSRKALFNQIVDIALTPSAARQRQRWQDLLAELFRPLHVRPAGAGAAAGIEEDGLGLTVPVTGGLPALRLDYADKGRRLFSPQDVALAEDLVSMLTHAFESRRAFENGVAEERARIARDMHDNMGAQLLGALHSRSAERKDSMIRESLSDLRDIINNLSRPGLSLDEVLADLRAETADRLSNAGLELDWCFEAGEPVSLPPAVAHALRSVLREAISNVIRHAGAGHVRVAPSASREAVRFSVEDDGAGFEPAEQHAGNGVANMKARVENLGGRIEILPAAPGTRIEAQLPLAKPEGPK